MGYSPASSGYRVDVPKRLRKGNEIAALKKATAQIKGDYVLVFSTFNSSRLATIWTPATRSPQPEMADTGAKHAAAGWRRRNA